MSTADQKPCKWPRSLCRRKTHTHNQASTWFTNKMNAGSQSGQCSLLQPWCLLRLYRRSHLFRIYRGKSSIHRLYDIERRHLYVHTSIIWPSADALLLRRTPPHLFLPCTTIAFHSSPLLFTLRNFFSSEKKKTATYFSAYATSGATPEPKLWDKQRKNCLKAVRAPTCRGLWSTTRDEPGHSIGQCLLFPVRFPTQLSAHSVLPPSEPNRVMTSSHKSPNHLLSFLADSNSAERKILSDGYSFECSWHGRSNY